MGEMDKRMHIICVYPNKLAAVMNTVNKMNALVCTPQRIMVVPPPREKGQSLCS